MLNTAEEKVNFKFPNYKLIDKRGVVGTALTSALKIIREIFSIQSA